MELRTLKTFQVVAEELNLTRAAIKLNYSQPTVTKHIKSLEDELGTLLLDKQDGRYVLTYAGEELYQRVITILKEVALIESISPEHGDRYQMKLQGHDYYGFNYFLPAIRQMYKKYPTISFKINSSNNEDTVDKLLKNEIDIGVVTGKIISSDLDYDVIGLESVCLCISEQNYSPQKDLDYYLEKYPIIIDQSEKYNYQNVFQKSLTTPTIIDCDSDEVVQEAVLQGNMLGIVRTGRLQQLIDSGQIKVIDMLSTEEPVNIVTNKDNKNDPHINALYSIIKYQSQFASIGIKKRFQWIQSS